jgi:hypothetical protein
LLSQEYFEGNDVDHSSEPPSAKGLAVFRDPNADINGGIKRRNPTKLIRTLTERKMTRMTKRKRRRRTKKVERRKRRRIRKVETRKTKRTRKRKRRDRCGTFRSRTRSMEWLISMHTLVHLRSI